MKTNEYVRQQTKRVAQQNSATTKEKKKIQRFSIAVIALLTASTVTNIATLALVIAQTVH